MLTKCIKCLYDPVSIGFKCKCKEVIPSSCHTKNWNDWNVLLQQGFTDNGMTCRPLESCVDNGNIFTKALCAWNLEGYYGYRCREGFRGDGYDGQGDCSWPFNPTFVLFLCEFSYTKTRWEVSSNQSRHVYIYPACAIQSAKSPSMPGRPIFVHNFQATAGKINNYIIYETGGFIFTPEGIECAGRPRCEIPSKWPIWDPTSDEKESFSKRTKKRVAFFTPFRPRSHLFFF